jgi:serine/threonine protein phosphatase PrpC
MSRTNRREIKTSLPRLRTALPSFRLVGHGATDVGLRREANEDSFLMLAKNHIWLVADGMGGHAGGQVASALTVEHVGRNVIRTTHQAETAQRQGKSIVMPERILEQSIRGACHAVFEEARQRPELSGMGSTVTAMWAYGGDAYFGQVGDSRAYLYRNSRLSQITEDHSLVQEQVAAGLITEEQAKFSMVRNIITRSIGFESDVEVDLFKVPMRVGDHYLLCSDGLTGLVEDHEIQDVITTTQRRKVPSTLIELANSRGGDDNTSVVFVSVLGGRRGTAKRRNTVPGQ